MPTKRKIIILHIFLILLFIGCRSEKPEYVINFTKNFPGINGNINNIWKNVKPEFLHHYYGEKPKDSLDFQASFKMTYNTDFLFNWNVLI